MMRNDSSQALPDMWARPVTAPVAYVTATATVPTAMAAAILATT